MGFIGFEDDVEICAAVFKYAVDCVQAKDVYKRQVPASEQTSKGLADWQDGKTSYLSVFEATLRRYGFKTEVQP